MHIERPDKDTGRKRKMNLQEEINYWKQKIRILKDWEITLNCESEYKAQVMSNVQKKMATIYAWPDDNVPKDYIFHEMLHIALMAVHHPKGFRKELEEKLIHDICSIVNFK